MGWGLICRGHIQDEEKDLVRFAKVSIAIQFIFGTSYTVLLLLSLAYACILNPEWKSNPGRDALLYQQP
jgi:hypothetical protein